ncbi:6-carboxy-5,6,7,8-tetrahydropterin synthase [Vibrio chagasii]|nr:6-carboxy-5,6,7,8-tetrahydropterin synthase [Vibrio chagasii]CAH6834910.1 6-carboxy-5,6,7,8-tetrahydropterin synthase [Vibrio chagasii]CAH6837263.1 6-carboxy-5,6,7,8-tetrahydropterin synthase [Vibrio chagasii]CAH6846900.1 6-carboxy-5,6,7,8-tetrahydropterin synthase [Vibrio chagasii]CAH6850822.1 6-carboxy-5,6,7,8-tetrahydropterin synthase [Vibrio chagasii]
MNLFVRDLTVIDSSYICEHRGVVGDSWILDVTMSGELNEMSMVLDFSRVKKQIKNLVDQHVDHRLLLPMKNAAIVHQASKPGYAKVDVLRGDKSLYLHCPDEAYCLIDAEAITIESVTAHVYDILRDNLPSNVTGLEITLRHENINGAFYHYTHGLKKHDGNCQRIAHGHRSPVEIVVDGQRDEQRELAFAKRWEDIYLGSKEDQVSVSSLNLSEHAKSANDESHYGFQYTAPQGEFELAIAKSETEILPTDTTVELLAGYIADQVAPSLAENQSLQIVAYEGVGKGAMAFR